MPTWDEIKRDVENNGNVNTVIMQTLRDAAGAGRLGPWVNATIASELAGRGLGHVPQSLSASLNQYDRVRLYKRGTAIGDFIDLVIIPREQDDQKLRELFTTQPIDYAAIVAQVRELVTPEPAPCAAPLSAAAEAVGQAFQAMTAPQGPPTGA